IDPLRRVEVDLAGDAAGKRRRVELRDGANAAAAGGDRGEIVLAADSVRAEGPDARDDDSFVVHVRVKVLRTLPEVPSETHYPGSLVPACCRGRFRADDSDRRQR